MVSVVPSDRIGLMLRNGADLLVFPQFGVGVGMVQETSKDLMSTQSGRKCRTSPGGKTRFSSGMIVISFCDNDLVDAVVVDNVET